MSHQTRIALWCACTVSVCLAVPVSASVNLGTAGNYAALSLNNTYVFMGNDTTLVNGNMGIGSGSFGFLQKGTVAGVTYVSTPSVPNVTFGGSWVGTVNTSLNLTQEVADAVAASNAAAGLATNRFDVTALTANTTIVGNGGTNVFSLTSINLNNKVVTLSGTASDLFIFNVTGDVFYSSTTINLNGLNAGQVLFNVIGSAHGNDLELRNSGTFRGTLLAPDRAIRVDHLTVVGALIGGRDPTFTGLDKDGSSFSIHSAAQVNHVPFVPAPGTLALLGGAAAIGLRRRR